MVKTSEQAILEVISKALKLKDDRPLTLNSNMNDTEGWDSLGHLSILSALDKLYNGKIAPIREMATADSVAKIVQLLRKHSFI